MAIKQDTRETVIEKVSQNKPEAEAVTIQASQVSRPFKSKSLAELLESAARLKRIAAALGSADEYELDATYNIETDEWTGRLCKK